MCHRAALMASPLRRAHLICLATSTIIPTNRSLGKAFLDNAPLYVMLGNILYPNERSNTEASYTE
jgi:hypothetical protein